MPKLIFNNIEHRLELIDEHEPQFKPIYVDFTAGKMAYRQQQGIGKRDPLARAVGIKKNYLPTVIDATAGLGRDAFVLASLGCEITLLERSPVIAELLADGLARARKEPELADIIARMHLQQGDSIQYLSNLATTARPDVIYLDPMYPLSQKSALVKKDMRILRDVVGSDADNEALFSIALAKAKQRVVVKRHRHANAISAIAPTHSISTKILRFDVYIISVL